MKSIAVLSYDLPPSSLWGVAKHVNKTTILLREYFEIDLISQSKNSTNKSLTISSSKAADQLIRCELMPFESYTDFDYLQSWNYLLANKVISEIKQKPDIVHNHNWMTFLAAKRVADFFGAKLISTIHFLQKQYGTVCQNLPIDSTEIIELENSIFSLSDKIVLFGKNHQQFVLDNYRCDPEKIVVIPHGVSVNTDVLEKPLSKNITILFVGRLVEEKGILDLANVVNKLQRKHNNIYLEIAGRGPLSNHPDLNKPFIKLHGFLDETQLNSLYSKADIFCFTSFTETFGLTAIEAAIHGLPIITTYGKNIEELFLKGEALFVDVRSNNKQSVMDAEMLYNHVEKLLNSKDLRNFYSEKAKLASLRYSESIMIERMRFLYDTI